IGILFEDIRHLQTQGIERHERPAYTRTEGMGVRLRIVMGLVAACSWPVVRLTMAAISMDRK
ncbi:hypothetical protein D0N87_31850, partial [Pseudomonas sp. ATCC 13867]